MHAARPGQRRRGRLLLDPEQPAQGPPAESGQRLGEAGRDGDGDVVAAAIDGHEGHDLVERPLHEQLRLRVLVSGAHGGERRRAGVDHPAVAVDALAETFGPELAEPLGDIAQTVAVGHQHVNPRPGLGVRRPVERGVERGGIVEERARLGPRHGGRRAGQQRLDVDAHQRGGEEPHRREHAEAPADLGRHLERGDPFPAGQIAQLPALGPGGEHQVPAGGAAERRVEPPSDDEILGQRFQRPTGLAHHVDQHPPRVDAAERAGHRGRVHVVEHRQAGKELPRLVVQLVPGRGPQRADERAGAQRGAADPEQQDVVVGLAQALGEARDLPDGALLLGQAVEAVLARGPSLAHLVLHGGKAAGQLLEPPPGQPVLAVEAVLQDAPVVESDHDTSTVSPS